ncbi:hypothetical protein DFH27DRAFT_608605 [Peziza echinospora]|nr:hypothetical protein DFH27DRAFT_608605 [Peziza echinospora]
MLDIDGQRDRIFGLSARKEARRRQRRLSEPVCRPPRYETIPDGLETGPQASAKTGSLAQRVAGWRVHTRARPEPGCQARPIEADTKLIRQASRQGHSPARALLYLPASPEAGVLLLSLLFLISKHPIVAISSPISSHPAKRIASIAPSPPPPKAIIARKRNAPPLITRHLQLKSVGRRGKRSRTTSPLPPSQHIPPPTPSSHIQY